MTGTRGDAWVSRRPRNAADASAVTRPRAPGAWRKNWGDNGIMQGVTCMT